MIETIRQGLREEGITVSISKLCQWFDVPRRTVYYRPVKSAPKVQAKFAEPIKTMIEESPSFGYTIRLRSEGLAPAIAEKKLNAVSGIS